MRLELLKKMNNREEENMVDVRDYRDLLEMEEMVGVAQEKIVEALETKAVQLEYNEAYRWGESKWKT